MKKLTSYHVFLARYFFWAGAILLLVYAVLPGSPVLEGIGSCLALAGSLVDLASLLREIRMEQFGQLHIPEEVRVVIPKPGPLHIRGVFFFVLECTVDGRTIQSPLMAMPKWSKCVRNGTLIATPRTTVYTLKNKALVIAHL